MRSTLLLFRIFSIIRRTGSVSSFTGIPALNYRLRTSPLPFTAHTLGRMFKNSPASIATTIDDFSSCSPGGPLLGHRGIRPRAALDSSQWRGQRRQLSLPGGAGRRAGAGLDCDDLRNKSRPGDARERGRLSPRLGFVSLEAHRNSNIGWRRRSRRAPELRLETFFPADDSTRDFFHRAAV